MTTTMTTKATDTRVLRFMEQIGGGFTSALAVTWRKADLENQRRLMTVFQDTYEWYEQALEEANKVQAIRDKQALDIP